MLKFIENLIDVIFRMLPQQRPSSSQVAKVKLVAHRGAHKYGLKENTLKGFERCIEQRIWGIEFDIRWTQDYEPILIHDDNAGQVFHRPDIVPGQVSISQLKATLPEIPTLEEVVVKFGGKIHFMIELKKGFSNYPQQIERLLKVLAPLRPVEDYHLLSLFPQELLVLSQLPKAALIGISFVNTKTIADTVIANSLGGHCGHYFLLNKKIRKRHKAAGHKIGTGYVSSKHVLYREINSGTKWIFTNKPFEIQLKIDALNRNGN